MKSNRNSSMVMMAAILAAIVGVVAGCNGASGGMEQIQQQVISVAIAPGGAQAVDQGQTKQFTANVSNDSSNKGVTWTLTQNGAACSPSCGSISPASTGSGQPTTYTAPAAVNANVQFDVTATSVADSTKSASDVTTDVPPPALNNPATLPAATIGQAYSYQLTETGGVPPYTWSVVSGSLPAGLTLSSSGLISGTPTAAAAATGQMPANSTARAQFASSTTTTSDFTVQMLDSGNPQLKVTQALSIPASQAPDFSLSASPSSLTVNQGASGTSTITIVPQGGFSGGVSLMASGLPNAVTASFSPVANNSSTLTLSASASATTGTVTVTITGTSGNLPPQTVTVSFTVAAGGNPVPTINSLSPSTAPPGSGPLLLDILGESFVSGATVQFGTDNLTPSSITPAEIIVTVPAPDLAAAASITVTVKNPSPGGGISNPVNFVVAIPPISVTVSAEPGCAAAGVPVNGTCLVYANIMNDLHGSGVTWSLDSAKGCPGATCGTILPRRQVSEATAQRGDYEMLYFGPDDRLNSPATVTVIATSVADPTKSGSTTITLTSFSLSIGVVSPLISSNASSTTGGTGDSYEPVVDIDGGYVAFTSAAPDLAIPFLGNTQPEVFARATCIGQPESCVPLGTIAVSVDSGGNAGNSGPSNSPSISFSGGVVAFVSAASNLDPTITTPGPAGLSYVYAADQCVVGHCQVPAPHLISVDKQKTVWTSADAVVSPDGRWVAFDGLPGELVEDPLNPNGPNIVSPGGTYFGDACTGSSGSCIIGTVTYLHDRTGNPLNVGNFVTSQITSPIGPVGGPSGGFMVFTSNATNLVPGVTSGNQEVFEIELVSGNTYLVSQDNSGKPASFAGSPSVSADGRYVSFLSSGLVPNDTNGLYHVYVRDTCLNVFNCTPATTLVDVATVGANAGNSSLGIISVGSHAISADGRYVAFSVIHPVDLTSVNVVSTGYFVRDMSCAAASAVCVNAGINLVNVSSSGQVIQEGSSMGGSISGDGQNVVFTIGAGDTREAPVPNFHSQVVIARTGFPVTQGTPTLTSATPNIGQQGSTLSSVMITGEFTHFAQGGSTISFAPDATIAASNITVTDATHLTATLMIPPGAAIGAQTVTVTSSTTTGTETASLANGFTVATGAPVISQVTPSFGQQGATLSNVTITGLFTHFAQGTSTVSFAPDTTIAASSVSVIDATHLTTTLTIPQGAATGPQTVNVTTGAEVASLSDSFSVTAAAGPPPMIITTTALANAAVNFPYDGPPVTALGGTSPYVWAETTGLFDPATGQGKSGACVGLTLDLASATLSLPLSGRPANAGMCGPFTLKIADSSPSQQTATRVLSVNVTMPTTRFAFMVDNDSTISTYAVDSATGQLRANGYSLAADTSFTTTLIKNKFLLTRPAAFQMGEYTFDPLTGAVNVPPTVLNPPRTVGGDVVAHPTANFLYFATGDVLSIDLTTGAVAPITNSPFPMPGTGGNVAMDPAGKFLFVGITITGAPNTLAAFSVDSATGALTIAPGSPFAASSACTSPNCPLAVDASGQFLYIPVFSASGPGMYAFKIDPSSAALTPLAGSPFAMPGSVQAMALSTTSTGEFLYVNALPKGATTNSPNVFGFKIDPTSGALSALPAPFPTFNNAIPMSVDVDPTGNFLYVNGRTSNITPNANGSIVSVFQIQSDGSLILASSILNQHGSTSSMLFSTGPAATFAPSFVLSANAGSTTSPATAGNISSYVVDPSAGSLAAVANSPFAAGNNPSSVALDRLNRFAVVSNLEDNTISSFTVGIDGSLTSTGAAVAAGLNPADLIIDPSGRFVFAVNRGDNTVSAYSLDQTTGQLTPLSEGTTPGDLASPTALAMDPSGLFFYVANSAGSRIVIYSVSLAGRFQPGSVVNLASGATPESLVVDPSGNYLYVADANGDVEAFSISTAGQLSALASSPTSAGTTTMSVAVDPTSRFVYAANQGSANVSGYDLALESGALTQFTSSPFAAGNGPVSLAVDPSGRFLYVANQTDGSISVLSIDPKTGALTPAAAPTARAGVNPAKVVVGEIAQ